MIFGAVDDGRAGACDGTERRRSGRDRCLSYYAPDVVVKDANGNVVMDGADVVRARYARSMTENPDIHYDIRNRIALGAFVVDEERVTGLRSRVRRLRCAPC